MIMCTMKMKLFVTESYEILVKSTVKLAEIQGNKQLRLHRFCQSNYQKIGRQKLREKCCHIIRSKWSYTCWLILENLS